MLVMLTELMSGLALFLFGMKFMSEGLQKAAGDKMRVILDRVTQNRFIAVLFGAIFTAVIQSSGATTVMEVSFVNAGLLSLEQSVGITFGANIGTTITAQLVSLKLTAIAPYIIFLGACLMMFGNKPITRKISEVIFGFGALFLGINSMTAALSTIPEYPVIMHWFSYLKNPFIALIVGLLFTVAVQSSSVTVSVLVLLADSNLVGLGSCLYFILGANIGSCTPALMAGMNANKNAKRTALVHLLFNAIGMIIIGTILFFAKDSIVDAITVLGGADNAKRFVANADTTFKVFQTLIFLPFASQFAKLTRLIIPGGKDEEGNVDDDMRLDYIGKATNKFLPSTAVVEIVQEIERMAGLARENLIASMESLANKNLDKTEEINRREKVIDYLSSEITNYLVEVNRYELPLSDSGRIGALFHVVIDLERIGDHAVNILENAEKRCQLNEKFTGAGKEELTSMYEKVLQLFDKSVEMFVTNKKDNIGEIISMENEVDQMQIDYQNQQVKRLSRGQCGVEIGLIFTDMVIGLERIADHSTNIAYSIFHDNPEDSETEAE
ncbi:MAG: Na/Pi cotransporter family protein [Eubacterium sp.]|nr:Na/Pi cotransporter family protein [Eubacterium sp.]MDD7210705.1 Na/Pi cotransporter family protein [Lachnospiraceae bacterium]MDY5496834.1 Na/Pi cotransporter family protein [Anaerobutyricum sp.]